MRHGAALALAHVQAVTLGDLAAKDLNIKLFGNDNVVDRYDEMIQRFSDSH